MTTHQRMAPTISLIAALDENGIIGRDGAMPWHLPADLKHFKALTLGKPIIMGRLTFDAIGKPLPDRRNIVLTRDRNFRAAGCKVSHTLDEALDLTADANEVMVIGGAAVYRQALPMADRLYLTRVHATLAGDTFFPVFDPAQWQIFDETKRPADERNPYDLSFQVLKRKPDRKPG